ncbi:type I restriction enzyme, S subunit [Ewingella americana]
MSWPMVKLSQVCSVLSGFAFKSNYFGDSGIPLVRIRDVMRGFSETYYSGEYDEQFVVNNNDILIGMDGDFNIAKWAGGEALLNQRVCKIAPVPSVVDADYLYYFLPLKLKEIWDETAFVTVKHLSVKKINDIEIPLPKLSIQKEISAMLRASDSLRNQSIKMESELNALAQAVFLDMFGHNQKMVKLGRYLDFITSGSRGWAQYYSLNGSRFLRSLDVRMNEIGSKEPVYVKAPNNKEAERARVRSGDILLTITGSQIGRVCWVPDGFGEAYVSQHVAILRLSHDLLPEFVSYFMSMESLGQKQISAAQYGQTKPGLNLEQIKSFTIPSVSIDQQKIFVDIMVKINALKANNRVSLQSYKDQFNALMQRAFSGKLDLKKVA